MSFKGTELSNKDVPKIGKALRQAQDGAEAVSLDDARQVLVQEQLMRLQECQTALREPQAQINQTLQAHNCAQVVEGQLPSGAWVPVSDLGFVDVRIRIVPK